MDRLHALCRGLWEHAREHQRPHDDLYGRLLAFSLDMEHYKRESGAFGRDTRRIQPKTQLLYDLIRHKGSHLKTQPIRIECIPARVSDDLAPAELSRRLLEKLVRDTKRRYRHNRDRAIDSALAASRGVMWASWEPSIGLRVEASDPRLTFVAPGWVDPHDPCCPWVCREMHVTKQWLESRRAMGWNVPKDLTPSRDPLLRHGQDPTHFNPGEDGGDAPEDEKEPRYTIVRMFFRDDPLRHVKVGAERPLPRDQWHLAGPDGPMPIPEGADIHDPVFAESVVQAGLTLVISEPEPAYQRLCVVFYPDYKGTNGIAWKGDWFDGAINEVEGHVPMPMFWLAAYQHPLRAIGTNDTLLNHTIQLLDDSAFRQVWEQTRQVSTVLLTQWGALVDGDRQQFRFTDAPVQQAYTNDPIALEQTRFINSPGISPGIATLQAMIERAGARVGTGDIPMPANRSRDIAAATMQSMQEMGDMPLRVHKALVDDAESMFFASWLGLCRAYMSDAEVLHWTTEQGDVRMAQVRGADLVPTSVIVGSSPDWKGLDPERVQAVAQFAGQILSLPGGPIVLPVLAKSAGFSASEVEEMRQMGQMMMMQQPQQPAA